MRITVKVKVILHFDLAGVAYSVGYRIVDKLRKAGAVSSDKAVSADVAHLSSQEIGWLQYLACEGSVIKKTRDGRYYV